MYIISIQNIKKKIFWRIFEEIFGKNVLNESMALVANFGTNIEMSLHETKQLPK